MKRLQLTAILSLLLLAATAQIPAGFEKGTVKTTDNNYYEGYIKNNIRQKSEVVFLTREGKKTNYTSQQLGSVTIGESNYLVIGNAFYKVVQDGPKMRLLRKASNASTIQYNGAEPISVSSGEGSYDDYFIQTATDGKLKLVRRKDFKKIFEATCADCTTLSEELRNEKISFAEIDRAVTIYNSCNK